MENSVVIIGRANVGKSTLFNKLSEKRQAMVSDIPGTTRDLKYMKISWQGKEFELIDTGGFLAAQKKPLKKLTKKEQKKFKQQAVDDIDRQVEQQARRALAQSNIVLFVVDAKEGLNPQDRQIANYLRKAKDKQVVLVINKCDNPKIREQVAEFHKLGLGEPVLVSAANGSGTGDLLDLVTCQMTKNKQFKTEKDEVIKVSILGKPNVGKSSLLNSLIGKDKVIVSDIPHTTREPNDTLISYQDNQILLVDTAGIRRKAKVARQSLEEAGVKMSIQSLKKSDLALLVLDLSQPISHQDLQLGKLIAESSVSVIMVANKYDLLKEKGENLVKEQTQAIYSNFPHLVWAPVVFTSAKTGWNVKKILKLILETKQQAELQLPQSALNRFLKAYKELM